MNIGRLFLDVHGTINCLEHHDVQAERSRSRELVRRLIEADELDELRISIVSSESIKSVEESGYTLFQVLQGVPKVRFGHHHAEGYQMHLGGIIREDACVKAEQMIENLKVCEHTHCYYADDCNLNRAIMARMVKHFYPNINYVAFNPDSEALRGLNDAIEAYLDSKHKNK